MTSVTPKEAFIQGKNYLNEDNLDKALKSFEKAYKADPNNPEYMSYLGMCKALRGGEIGLARELCTAAIKKEFFKAEYYYNLGRVYIAGGNKKVAVKILLKGLRHDPDNKPINTLLEDLGFRRKPVIPALPRTNFVNKYLGILFRRMLPGVFGKKER